MCLTCSPSLFASCFTCSRASRVLCFTFSHTQCVSHPACSGASLHVSFLTWSHALIASCLICLHASRVLFHACCCALRALVPYKSRALHSLVHHVLPTLSGLVSHVSCVLLYFTCFEPYVFSYCRFLVPGYFS